MSLIRPPLLVRLVRLAPVLSSTATLALAFAEYQSLIPWVKLPSPYPEDLPVCTHGHLSIWFNRWFRPGLVYTLTLGVISVVGAKNAFASLYTATGDDKFVTARLLYISGACLTIVRFGFSSHFRESLRRLVRGTALDHRLELRHWLGLHTTRTLYIDLPAWLCFIGAFMYTV